MSVSEITKKLHSKVVDQQHKQFDSLIHQTTVELLYSNYINLIHDEQTDSAVKAAIYKALTDEVSYLKKKLKRVNKSSNYYAFYRFQLDRISKISPANLKKEQLIKLPKMPPGSPI